MKDGKKYHVVEGVIHTVFSTDNRAEAMADWRTRHRNLPSEYHEVYELWEDGIYHGICQFKPNDKVRW